MCVGSGVNVFVLCLCCVCVLCVVCVVYVVSVCGGCVSVGLSGCLSVRLAGWLAGCMFVCASVSVSVPVYSSVLFVLSVLYLLRRTIRS